MMLAALLATALTAQAPPGAGVSLGSAVNVSAADAEALLVQLDAALRQAGLEPRRVGGGCKGDLQCVAKQAGHDGLSAIVTVAVAGSKRGLAVDVESVSSEGAAIAQLTERFTSPSDPRVAEVFAAHARRVVEALKPKDAPLQARVEPAPTPEPVPVPSIHDVEDHGPPRWLVIGAAGAAVVAAVFAVAFAVQGFRLKSVGEWVEDGRAVNSEVDAQRLVGDANARLTASLMCGITAAVFTAAAAGLGIARF